MSIAITAIRTIGIPVTDQDRAVQFYVGVLGLAKGLDVPTDQLGGRWIEVAPAGSATSIALVASQTAGADTGIRLTVADAASVRTDLLAAGIEVGELLKWDGVPPMFAFRDPDGNGLKIVQQARIG